MQSNTLTLPQHRYAARNILHLTVHDQAREGVKVTSLLQTFLFVVGLLLHLLHLLIPKHRMKAADTGSFSSHDSAAQHERDIDETY